MATSRVVPGGDSRDDLIADYPVRIIVPSTMNAWLQSGGWVTDSEVRRRGSFPDWPSSIYAVDPRRMFRPPTGALVVCDWSVRAIVLSGADRPARFQT